MDFFTSSTTNLLTAAANAGVRHYVALSVGGADRVPDSGYLRAKVAQEKPRRPMPAPYRAASSFLREGTASPFTTSKGAQA
jgi:hypothetical protein